MVWTVDNKAEIYKRLAPRLPPGTDPAGDPEAFADATYLNDHRAGSDAFLRLKNESQRPFLPNGSTPLGYSLKSIREWFRGCENGVCPSSTGWDDIAAANDPNWSAGRST